MGLRSKLLLNTTYLTIGSQIGNALQLAFFVYFARQFGEKIVGQYSFAFSFTFLLLIFADLGLSSYLIREVSRDHSENRQIFARCLTLRLITIVFVSVFGIIIVFLFSRSFSRDAVKIIILLGLYQVFFSIADVFLAEFKAHDRMALVAVLGILLKFLISTVGILFIISGVRLLAVLTCFPIGSLLYLALCTYLSFHYFGTFNLNYSKLGHLLLKMLPFAFTIIFVESLYHQDILMLRFLKSDESVGIYSAANSIILAFLGILFFVHTALLPSFSRLFVESTEKLIEISRHWLRYLLILGLPVATGLFAISDQLIILFFSSHFENSIPVLKILSGTIALGLAAATYSVLLTAINRQTEKVISIAICLAFNLVLNLLLIPSFDYHGAAVAKLMTEALHFVLMAYLVSKYLCSLSVYKILLKPALSCLLMYTFISLFHQLHLIYLVPLSACIYLSFLALMRAFDTEELAFVKQLALKSFLRSNLPKTYHSK